MVRSVKVLVVLVLAAVVGCKSKPADSPPAPTAKPAAAAPAAAPQQDWATVAAGAGLDNSLATFAAAALASGKKPFVYLHAEWCPPCKAIEATRTTDPKMIEAFHGTAIATIDIDAADPKALEAQGLQTSTIPVFYRLDKEGHPTGDRIDGGAWGDNIPENMAPPLKAFFSKG